MNLAQIRIQSQPGLIEINSTSGQQSIEQPGPTLDIQQPPVEMHIERTPSHLTIDQSQAWADMHMENPIQFNMNIAQQAIQDCMKGTQRRVQEGDELMRIENGGSPIAAIAKRNSEKTSDFTMGAMPSYGSVKIQYEPSKVDITWDIHKPINNSKANAPIIQYQPGNVSVQLKQSPSVKIDFVNLKYVGINYEQEI
jgi:hypothetical protein